MKIATIFRGSKRTFTRYDVFIRDTWVAQKPSKRTPNNRPKVIQITQIFVARSPVTTHLSLRFVIRQLFWGHHVAYPNYGGCGGSLLRLCPAHEPEATLRQDVEPRLVRRDWALVLRVIYRCARRKVRKKKVPSERVNSKYICTYWVVDFGVGKIVDVGLVVVFVGLGFGKDK